MGWLAGKKTRLFHPSILCPASPCALGRGKERRDGGTQGVLVTTTAPSPALRQPPRAKGPRADAAAHSPSASPVLRLLPAAAGCSGGSSGSPGSPRSPGPRARLTVLPGYPSPEPPEHREPTRTHQNHHQGSPFIALVQSQRWKGCGG